MSSVESVIELLKAKAIPYDVLPHKTAYTAATEAEAIHVPREDVLKTVVLDTGSGHAIAVLPGSRKLDMDLVRQALGDGTAHLATEPEIGRDFPEFEPGAVPPLQSLAHVPVYIDPEVMLRPVVVFAESQTESIRARTEDLFAGESVTVTPIARRNAVDPGANH
jgi:Ala-tRNA(Pro) deacylase